MLFDSIPTYNRYRTLRLLNPQQQGEDVFALQTALNEAGFPCGEPDGILGPMTDKAIKQAQTKYRLVVDGLAGGMTQRELALDLAQRVSVIEHVPFNAFRGQLEHESGYRLGNYSPPREDGSYDAGVAQRNTKFTPPSQGFDCKVSIEALGAVVRKHYDLFAGINANDRRRWALAQGAWNAPAFACFIARELGAPKVTASMTARPSASARETFETYVTNVSAYL